MSCPTCRPRLAAVRDLAGSRGVVPIARSVPSDVLTPVSAFLRLRPRSRRPFLLESVEGGDLVGRYSFIGLDPVSTLDIREGVLWVDGQAQRRLSAAPDRGALADVAALLDSAPLLCPDDQLAADLPPLTSGWVGLAAYDLIRFLEPLGSEADGPYAGEALRLGEYRTIVAFDRVRQRIWVVSSFLLEGSEDATAVEAAYWRAVATIGELVAALQRPHWLEFTGARHGGAQGHESRFRGLDRTTFEGMVERAKEYIAAGDIFQVVLSQRFTGRTGAHPFDVYRALRMVNPSPYLFYLEYDDQVLLGASPEMLVRIQDQVVQTRPIAGTRRRGATPREDLRLARELEADPKERAEHIMLVDLGRNDLGRVAKPGTLRVPQLMQVETFSHVMHLVSLVEGELRDELTPFDAFLSCFPAGTVSGAPKVRAMQIIDELEGVPRGTYAGAVVYLDQSGNLDSCIAIRCIVARPLPESDQSWEVWLQAGAGIVADSDPGREYEETQHKAAALRAAIDLAENDWQTPGTAPGPTAAAQEGGA